MKAILGRSVIIASVLLLGLIIFSAKPSVAETPFSQFPSQKEASRQNSDGTLGKVAAEAALIPGLEQHDPNRRPRFRRRGGEHDEIDVRRVHFRVGERAARRFDPRARTGAR